ncbi:hypothetical protein ACWEV3_40980 [Saccharopolyspora sp. NPDC003752]
MTAALPWVPGAVRALLLADAEFSAACGGYCAPTSPTTITGPFAQLRLVGNFPLAGNVAFRPLVQVDGWAPASMTTVDPTAAAWRVAAEAARVLAGAANVRWSSIDYSARVVDGPVEGVADTSRGTATALLRALVRAELTVHNH